MAAKLRSCNYRTEGITGQESKAYPASKQAQRESGLLRLGNVTAASQAVDPGCRGNRLKHGYMILRG